jgi:hypothetical protein
VADLSYIIIACTLAVIASLAYVAWMVQDAAERLARVIQDETRQHARYTSPDVTYLHKDNNS